tara:strand:- start:6724 stop:7767 length:1044 start_codon:yes stop_codon:yes gene_type:complete
MKRILMAGIAAIFAVSTAQAQSVKLTLATATAGGPGDISAKALSEIAAKNNIASIQVQTGQVLTKTIQQVAEGKTDISTAPFILKFLMAKGLGPYSGLGKEKGKKLANNLRLLYPYHLGGFYLTAFQTTGIDSFAKLKGKTVHNGPPRGGALILARSIIQLAAGLKDGKDYTGKQVAWGQANSIFLDRSVDAAVRPGTNPAPHMPILMSAGKINLISVPKAKFESPAMQKMVNAPGRVAVVFPVSGLAHYGPKVRVISDDNMFRTVADAAGDIVHKNMDKGLAKKLTAAFLKNLPNLYKKAAFAKAQAFGSIDNKKMGICKAGIKLHPGAVEAWEEAGHKVAACMKP